VIEQASRPGVDDSGAVMKGAEISTPHSGLITRIHGPARWRGLKTAHRDASHETSVVGAAFDKHRAGSHTHDARHCLDPATVGLVDGRRDYPLLGLPGRGEGASVVALA
jgi:hypothetical protein